MERQFPGEDIGMTGGWEVSRASRPAVYIDEPRKSEEAPAWLPGSLRFCLYTHGLSSIRALTHRFVFC